MVESRTPDPKSRGSNPVRSTRNNSDFFLRVENVVLTRCQCAQPQCVYCSHNNDDVRTLKDHVSPNESSVDYRITKRPSTHFRIKLGLGSATLSFGTTTRISHGTDR